MKNFGGLTGVLIIIVLIMAAIVLAFVISDHVDIH